MEALALLLLGEGRLARRHLVGGGAAGERAGQHDGEGIGAWIIRGNISKRMVAFSKAVG